VPKEGAVAVHGEVDLLTAPELETHLRAAAGQINGDITIDLSGVTFMDSAGMNVLVRVFKLLDAERRALRLVNACVPVRRALEVGGVATFAQLD
jgi:anti-sigma B factor antagonist